RLDAADAHERLRQHDAGTTRALCLVNTVADYENNLKEGARVCEQTLALFDVLDREDWANDPSWHHLTLEERRRLAENTRELLMLLAHARWSGAPTDAITIRKSLALLDRAEAIPDLEPTPALWQERARYYDLLGETDKARAARERAKQMPPRTAR